MKKRLLALVATLATLALLGGTPAPATALVPPVPPGPDALRTAVQASSTLPLDGVTIALDPGHQLGNHNFPEEIGRLVPAGGFRKPCNTTGTATNGGYPEASLTFRIARIAQDRLRELGATVHLTRRRNAESLWGPCVNTRGAFGRSVGARLMVSLHGDGAAASGRGFHVIAPARRAPWTDDIAGSSLRLAKALRAAYDDWHIRRSTYLAGGTALVVRSDLATLNLSDVPVAMLEVGNMRNSLDARLMRSPEGQYAYAIAVVRGIRRYLGR